MNLLKIWNFGLIKQKYLKIIKMIMKSKKLELKDIVGYLPYDSKARIPIPLGVRVCQSHNEGITFKN